MWKHTQKPRSHKRGFTMVELLTVIGIIALTCAIAIPSIIAINKSLTFKQRNDYAESIFMAAQQNLTRMRSEGTLGELNAMDEAAHGARADLTGFPLTEGASEYRYVLSHDVKADAFDKVLPAAAIDSHVRDMRIVIEYNPVNGNVFSVFCYGSGSDSLLSDYRSGLPREESARRDLLLGYYEGSGLSGMEIDADELITQVKYDDGQEGTVQVYVQVPSDYASRIKDLYDNLEIVLDVTGDLSKYKWEASNPVLPAAAAGAPAASTGESGLIPAANPNEQPYSYKVRIKGGSNNCDVSGDRRFVIVSYPLDSLAAHGSFAHQSADSVATDAAGAVTKVDLNTVTEDKFKILPGDNVSLTANVIMHPDKRDEAVDYAPSSLSGVNPLFEYLTPVSANADPANAKYIIGVKNGRHLQNLNLVAPYIADRIDSVVITDDINWQDTLDAYNQGNTIGKELPARFGKYFVPIQNEHLFGDGKFNPTMGVLVDSRAADRNAHCAKVLGQKRDSSGKIIPNEAARIYNLNINAGEYRNAVDFYTSNSPHHFTFTGLFGYANTSIQNLALVDPIVVGHISSANVIPATGALLGAGGVNTLVQNCSTYLDMETGTKYEKLKTHGVTGWGAVGGLVGYAGSNRILPTLTSNLEYNLDHLTFVKSFAAVPVVGTMTNQEKSEGRPVGLYEGVGGFIGNAHLTNSWDCYASGSVHSTYGQVREDPDGPLNILDGYDLDTDAGEEALEDYLESIFGDDYDDKLKDQIKKIVKDNFKVEIQVEDKKAKTEKVSVKLDDDPAELVLESMWRSGDETFRKEMVELLKSIGVAVDPSQGRLTDAIGEEIEGFVDLEDIIEKSAIDMITGGDGSGLFPYRGRTSSGAGGFVGTSHGARYSNCFATGSVTSGYNNAGGFVGVMCIDGHISFGGAADFSQLTIFDNCYAFGGSTSDGKKPTEPFAGIAARDYLTVDYLKSLKNGFTPDYYTRKIFKNITGSEITLTLGSGYIFRNSYFYKDFQVPMPDVTPNSNYCAQPIPYKDLQNLLEARKTTSGLFKEFLEIRMEQMAALDKLAVKYAQKVVDGELYWKDDKDSKGDDISDEDKKEVKQIAKYVLKESYIDTCLAGLNTYSADTDPFGVEWKNNATTANTHPYDKNRQGYPYPFTKLSTLHYYGFWPDRPPAIANIPAGIGYYEIYKDLSDPKSNDFTISLHVVPFDTDKEDFYGYFRPKEVKTLLRTTKTTLVTQLVGERKPMALAEENSSVTESSPIYSQEMDIFQPSNYFVGNVMPKNFKATTDIFEAGYVVTLKQDKNGNSNTAGLKFQFGDGKPVAAEDYLNPGNVDDMIFQIHGDTEPVNVYDFSGKGIVKVGYNNNWRTMITYFADEFDDGSGKMDGRYEIRSADHRKSDIQINPEGEKAYNQFQNAARVFDESDPLSKVLSENGYPTFEQTWGLHNSFHTNDEFVTIPEFKGKYDGHGQTTVVDHVAPGKPWIETMLNDGSAGGTNHQIVDMSLEVTNGTECYILGKMESIVELNDLIINGTVNRNKGSNINGQSLHDVHGTVVAESNAKFTCRNVKIGGDLHGYVFGKIGGNGLVDMSSFTLEGNVVPDCNNWYNWNPDLSDAENMSGSELYVGSGIINETAKSSLFSCRNMQIGGYVGSILFNNVNTAITVNNLNIDGDILDIINEHSKWTNNLPHSYGSITLDAKDVYHCDSITLNGTVNHYPFKKVTSAMDIKNVTINGTQNYPLIGELSAGSIAGMTLTSKNAQAAAGSSFGLLAEKVSDGSIQNCKVDGRITCSGTNTKKETSIGGMVGVMNGGSIADSTVSGSLMLSSGTGDGKNYFIGGVVGKEDNIPKYSNVHSTMNISPNWADPSEQDAGYLYTKNLSDPSKTNGSVGMFIGRVEGGQFKDCSGKHADNTIYQFLGSIKYANGGTAPKGSYRNVIEDPTTQFPFHTQEQKDKFPGELTRAGYAEVTEDTSYGSFSASLQNCSFNLQGETYFQDINTSFYFELQDGKMVENILDGTASVTCKEQYTLKDPAPTYNDLPATRKYTTTDYYILVDGTYYPLLVKQVTSVKDNEKRKYTFAYKEAGAWMPTVYAVEETTIFNLKDAIKTPVYTKETITKNLEQNEIYLVLNQDGTQALETTTGNNIAWKPYSGTPNLENRNAQWVLGLKDASTINLRNLTNNQYLNKRLNSTGKPADLAFAPSGSGDNVILLTDSNTSVQLLQIKYRNNNLDAKKMNFLAKGDVLMGWTESEHQDYLDAIDLANAYRDGVSPMVGFMMLPDEEPPAPAEETTAPAESPAEPEAPTEPPVITPANGSEWQANAFYAVDSTCVYQGIEYVCIYEHVSYEGVDPLNAPGLWVRTDTGEPGVSEDSTTETYSPDEPFGPTEPATAAYHSDSLTVSAQKGGDPSGFQA